MEKLSSPRISVLMPAYKTPEPFLRQAVDSILAQTYTDFELIIVDDCPEDTLVECVVRSYTDPRLHYYRNGENLGISGTRNKLLDLACGEYLATMDHDDISLPLRFEKQVAFLEANPEVGVVGCFAYYTGMKKILEYPTTDEEIKINLMEVCAILHPASMLRKSVLTASGLRYEAPFSPSEDYALWCRLISHTQFANIPEVLFIYREHQTNTSKLFTRQMDEKTEAIYHFVRKENPTLWERYNKQDPMPHWFVLLIRLPFLRVFEKHKKYKVYFLNLFPLFTIRKRRHYPSYKTKSVPKREYTVFPYLNK